MAIIAEESVRSRSFSLSKDGFSVTRVFFVHGTDDPLLALPHIPGFGAQYIVDGMASYAWVTSQNIEQIPGADAMKATVVYGQRSSAKSAPPPPEENKASWRLSTAAVSVHVETVLSGKKIETIPADAKLNDQTIGVATDGVRGVDVLRPHGTLLIDHWLPVQAADSRFLDEISRLGGSVNTEDFSGPWGTWQAGEALYLGAEVSSVSEDLIQISHSFEREFNAITEPIKIKVANKDESITKKGWEYFWVTVADVKDPNDATSTTRGGIIAAQVAQVYPEADFGRLLLPSEFVGGAA